MELDLRALLQALFVASVAFSVYTLAGYPLLLALLTRFRTRPVRKSAVTKSVTVLLPVRNGEQWLRAKLESLLALQYPPAMLQILVISNGSNDDTDAIAQEFTRTGRVELLRLAGGGKAAALNAGLERARGEILFLTDVRQSLEPESLRHLVACFADESVGAVSGELVIRDGTTLEELSVGLYWKYEKWLRKHESQLDSVMGATGCIYAMRRELARPLPPGTLVDDMFLPLAAFFAGYRVILEDSAKAFDYPTALDTEFRRKVRTQAGVYQIIRLYPQLLTPRNRMWFVFASHKLARLLLPFALLLAAVTTFALEEPWRTPALLLQALLYSAALFDLWIPEEISAKRISAPLRSFVVLLAAAFCAAFVRPSENVWKETRVRAAGPLR
ncbi:MAG: family 2 glycosyl transferase [Terriglobia bacterium]|nr:MAG: family 2 glycosyl transferase [Terriglobia bacterium]